MRLMNLDDLVHVVRDFAARRYIRIGPLRNTVGVLSRAEVMEVQAISDRVARHGKIDEILQSQRVFFRSSRKPRSDSNDVALRKEKSLRTDDDVLEEHNQPVFGLD